ncbi:MAG: hypothetical protein U0003_01320 [Vampirovibrionales bacterium]
MMTAPASTPPSCWAEPIWACVHTHWDREWYWPKERYQARLVEVLRAVLFQLEAGTLKRFTLDGQTALLEDACELDASLRPRLKKWLQSGHLSMGPWYTAPDEWLVGGESLLRNLLVGLHHSQQWLQASALNPALMVGYLPDTFGHSRDMPMALVHMGMGSAMAWRGFNPKQSLFLWQSPDGSTVTTLHLRQGYFQNMLHDAALMEQERERALHEWVQAQAMPGLPTFLSIGGDHLGPPAGHGLAWLEDWAQRHTQQPLVWCHPAQYLHQCESMMSQGVALETVRGEALDNTVAYVLHGVWSARLDLKQRNRLLEHRFIQVLEPWWALLAFNIQADREAALRGSWQQGWLALLANHAHDSIGGCSVDAVHFANHARFDSVDACQTAMGDRLETLTETVLGGTAWVVNPQASPYTGWVPVRHRGSCPPEGKGLVWQSTQCVLKEDYRTDYRQVPLSHCVEDEHRGWMWVSALPPGGYAWSAQGQHPNGPQWGAMDEPNSPLPLTLTETSSGWSLGYSHGTLSLTSGRLVVETLTGDGIRRSLTLRLGDEPDAGDSYTRCPSGLITLDEGLTQWKWTLKTPWICQGEGLMTVCGEKITLSITVKAGEPRVDFEAQWVNTQQNHALVAWWQGNNPIHTLVAESHWGAVIRPIMQRATRIPVEPVAAHTEWVPNTGPIQRWVAVEGWLMLTQGLSEYEVQGQALGITLLRCFGQLSKGQAQAPLATRGGAAGPPFQTPAAQHNHQPCIARWALQPLPQATELEDALVPAWVSWANEQALAYYGTVQAWSRDAGDPFKADAFTPQPFLSTPLLWDNTAVNRVACKPHQQHANAWVLRLHNPTAQPQRVNFQVASGWRVSVSDGSETLPAKTQPLLEAITVNPHALVALVLQHGVAT